MRVLCAAMAAAMTLSSAAADVTLLDWSDLAGWSDDNHEVALDAFRITCGDLDEGDWPTVCGLSKEPYAARDFFETFFRPVLIEDGEPPLFTGYYEPELSGSRERTARFQVPLHRAPTEITQSNSAWLTRQQIETSGALSGRGLEIVWLEDPVDKFFLQIQGSGRVRLSDGQTVRVGYGGKNGHPYRSVGMELVRRGVFDEHQVSAPVIRRWVQDNPEAGTELLWHNPSYVFFREVSRVPSDMGPLGAMNRSVTAGRTLAVDPAFVPLGAPVWMEKEGRLPMRRLMVAQDTGSAIKGAQRADIFFGTGDEAGQIAGRTRDTGRMVVLLPVKEALDRVADG